ncbi:MAG: hypothetical protein KKD77_22280 [Gammaproteobacteria bacterium]|nr:hypothetical protein [Gammaproteobacteria bacterium]
MTVEDKMSQTNEGKYMTVAWGKLEVLPTNKGEDVFVNEVNLMSVLRYYDGRRVHIVIQEISEDWTYDSSLTTVKEEER